MSSFNRKINYKWPFSIAMLNCPRVSDVITQNSCCWWWQSCRWWWLSSMRSTQSTEREAIRAMLLFSNTKKYQEIIKQLVAFIQQFHNVSHVDDVGQSSWSQMHFQSQHWMYRNLYSSRRWAMSSPQAQRCFAPTWNAVKHAETGSWSCTQRLPTISNTILLLELFNIRVALQSLNLHTFQSAIAMSNWCHRAGSEGPSSYPSRRGWEWISFGVFERLTIFDPFWIKFDTQLQAAHMPGLGEELVTFS